jgi:hypothetical protein
MLNLSGSKTWDDSDNQDGVRPDSITVDLLADGSKVATATTDASKDWKYSFDNEPEFAAGKKIAYTVEEEAVDSYAATADGLNVTNTHVPATTEISGTKSWVDGNDQDGIRPDSVTVVLLADGEKVDSTTTNAKANWEYSFKDLPVYKAGKAIVYTVKESNVAAGYKATVDAATHDITNTHVPATTSVAGTKTWNDANNADNLRPSSVTVDLLANGVAADSATVTASDSWKYSFKDLPVYKDGKKITYTVKEDSVATGYSESVKGFDITNTHAPSVVSHITTPVTPKPPYTPVSKTVTTPSTKKTVKVPVTAATPVPVATAQGALAQTGASVEIVAAVLALFALAGFGLVAARTRRDDRE